MVSPRVLAIIPARGGSKSIPFKNIKPLNGIPLIAYSIKSGLESSLINRVIVSTDNKEIADLASHYGAEVPFMRPVDIALDDTPDLPVFKHALLWLKKNENYIPDIIVQLRPTSPFRPKGLIDRAIKLLLDNREADSVRAVMLSGQNPYKMWRMGKKYLQPLLKLKGNPEPFNSARQKLPQIYWQTGHIDVIRYKTIMEQSSMSGQKILPINIQTQYLVDIDTDQDWKRAEQTAKDLEVIGG